MVCWISLSTQMSKPLAEIARRCIRLNGYSEQVTVLQMHSSELVVGQHLPARVDVVVTELVDSGECVIYWLTR